MSDIKDDIAALEGALEAGPTPGPWHASGPAVAGRQFEPIADCELDTPTMVENADYIAACSPGRIRRLLDALKAEQDRNCMCVENNRRMNEAEAKLSRAVELLRLTHEAGPIFDYPADEVAAFLKEVGHE